MSKLRIGKKVLADFLFRRKESDLKVKERKKERKRKKKLKKKRKVLLFGLDEDTSI